MADALSDKETLNSGEIDELVAGVKKFIPEEMDIGHLEREM
jgi:hypothetical protein